MVGLLGHPGPDHLGDRAKPAGGRRGRGRRGRPVQHADAVRAGPAPAAAADAAPAAADAAPAAARHVRTGAAVLGCVEVGEWQR